MKTNAIIILLTLTAAGFLAACGADKNGDADQQKIITEKIEYPVFVKNPYEGEPGDWWKENIEMSKRLDFIETLFSWAYEGKVRAFDYLTNKPLSVDEVKMLGNETDTITVTDNNPPYDEKDTVIQNKLDFKQIHKVKFLEIWQFDLVHHTMSKRVLGIAPALTVYGDSSEVLGQKPLFWIYFDKEYIESLEKKH